MTSRGAFMTSRGAFMTSQGSCSGMRRVSGVHAGVLVGVARGGGLQRCGQPPPRTTRCGLQSPGFTGQNEMSDATAERSVHDGYS